MLFLVLFESYFKFVFKFIFIWKWNILVVVFEFVFIDSCKETLIVFKVKSFSYNLRIRIFCLRLSDFFNSIIFLY